MIAGIFHDGSGLGDQLMRYITIRTLAQDKGFDYAMVGEFKGDSFMKLKTSNGVLGDPYLPHWNEKNIRDAQGNDIRSYDPEINFVQDNTLIDGSFEDYRYWGHNLKSINEWLKVEPLEVPDWKIMVGFRGGEYYAVPELGLPPEYYKKTLALFPDKEYEIHTDDPKMAMEFFHSFKGGFSFVDNEQISHSKHTAMGLNWRTARYAKYAIIPNSAFFILPRLLKHFEDPTAVTLAPRFWAGYNQKIWKRPATYYSPFTYVHHEGDTR